MKYKYIRPLSWDKNRSTHFSLGLVLAIGFVVFIINMSFHPPTYKYDNDIENIEAHSMIPLTQWPIKKKALPNPTLQQDRKKAPVFDIKVVEQDLEESVVEIEEKKVEEDPLFYQLGEKAPSPSLEVHLVPEEVIETVSMAERMPIFGLCQETEEVDKRMCSDQALLKFIYKHLEYPNLARENKVEGMVIVEFVVDSKGMVGSIKILRGIGGGCDQAVKKVIEQLPAWLPGKQNGRPVNVLFRMPVKFKLD